MTTNTKPNNEHWDYDGVTFYMGGVVLQINEATGGIELRKQFTHIPDGESHDYGWYGARTLKTIRRFMYIDNTFYAISGDSISSYDLTSSELPQLGLVALE